MGKITLDLKAIDQLATSTVEVLADTDHQKEVLKRVFVAAYASGFDKGKQATVDHLAEYLGADV